MLPLFNSSVTLKLANLHQIRNVPLIVRSNRSTATLTGLKRISTPSSHVTRMSNPKPPNIFIYTGEDLENSSHFCSLQATFQNCLHRDKYVIYHLQPSKVPTVPWQENTAALIVCCKAIADSVKRAVHGYLKSGGKVLSLCSDLNCPGLSLTETDPSLPKLVSVSFGTRPPIKLKRGAFQISTREENGCEILAREPDLLLPLVVKCPVQEGTLVIAQVCLAEEQPAKEDLHLRDLLSHHLNLDCSQSSAPDLLPTPAHLFVRPSVRSMISELTSGANNVLQLRNMKLQIRESLPTSSVVTDLDAPYPVTLNPDGAAVEGFDCPLFYRHLTTLCLGSAVFFAETVTTTMDFLEGLPVDIGAVAVANVQTKGKGRAGNAWLSPAGCAMFSVQVCLDRDTHLGRALPLVQQLATLAVLLAVKGMPGPYRDLDIGLKWPNDLYYAKKVKLGGVLVKSTMIGNKFHCYLGIGVNLNNSLPTVCLNDLIRDQDRVHGTQTDLLLLEVLVARTLNHLERLTDECQQRGTDSVLPRLYQHWIHQDQTLMLEALNERVSVEGVDSSGFLCVRTSRGRTLTLHPDGNSLDPMKNLLIAK